MSQPGVGAMIQWLGGNKSSVEAIQASIGQEIKSVEIEDWDKDAEEKQGNALLIHFTNGTTLRLSDEGQSCCESRYMTIEDDNLPYFTGSLFQSAATEDGPETQDGEWGDTHEIQFLIITTSRGVFKVSSHVEHNGYYGGFAIVASII